MAQYLKAKKLFQGNCRAENGGHSECQRHVQNAIHHNHHHINLVHVAGRQSRRLLSSLPHPRRQQKPQPPPRIHSRSVSIFSMAVKKNVFLYFMFFIFRTTCMQKNNFSSEFVCQIDTNLICIKILAIQFIPIKKAMLF